MNFDFQNLVFLQPINGATINTVVLSSAVRNLLYTLAVVTLIISTVFFLFRNAFAIALRKAIVIAFFFSGLIYAVQGDIVWTSWLITDTKTYAGLTTDEKLGRFEGPFYEFILSARNVIHGDYMLFSPHTTTAMRTEYFLLPLRKREQADYIVVIQDEESYYNEVDRTFIRGSLKINHLEPIYVMTPGAYILGRMP